MHETPDPVEPVPPAHGRLGRLARIGWTASGCLFLAIGIIGIYLPGIPTTGPLILAAFLFGKGHPQWRRRMLDAPLLASYRTFLDGNEPLSWRARLWAMLGMWTSIGFSCWLLSYSTTAAGLGVPACLLGGIAGSLCILLYRP